MKNKIIPAGLIVETVNFLTEFEQGFTDGENETSLGHILTNLQKKIGSLKAQLLPYYKDICNKSIFDFELSTRAKKVIQESGLKTLGDFNKKTQKELLTIKNFGWKTLLEVSCILENNGLSIIGSTLKE